MKFELANLPRNCSQEEIIEEVKRVDAIVNKDILTKRDFDKHAKVTAGYLGRRFGDWQSALILAGLGHKYSGKEVSEKMRKQQAKKLTDEEILNELRRVAAELKQDYVRQEDVNKMSHISASAVVYRFGSWADGVKHAGLMKSPQSYRKFSEDDLFENLLNVWTHYGRQPKYGEMSKPPSEVSPKTYENRFGSWRKALEAFVSRMNQDEKGEEHVKDGTFDNQDRQEIQEKQEVSRIGIRDIGNAESRRSINLGLRYKVLSRDNFKCVRCGASPATNHSCKLHVDHIVPFSKDGKTVIDNLQTLCEQCNLGKGNRHNE